MELTRSGVVVLAHVPEEHRKLKLSLTAGQVESKRKVRKSGSFCLVIFLVGLVILVPTQVSLHLTKAAAFTDGQVQILGNEDTK